MKKKKCFLFFILAFLAFGQIHAEKTGRDILFADTQAGMPEYSNNTSLIDLPLSGGITQFAVAIYDFTGIVIKLITLFSFLAIVFNAFKLWAGTMELKKVYVDLIYKFVMCIVLLHIYIPVTDKLVQVATHMGATCAGGYKKIDVIYTEAYSALSKDIEKGLEAYQQYISSVIAQLSKSDKLERDENGMIYFPESLIKELVNYGMSEKAAQDFAKQRGLNIVHTEYEDVTYTNDLNDMSSAGSGVEVETTSLGTNTWLVDSNGKRIQNKSYYFGFSSREDRINSIASKAHKKFKNDKEHGEEKQKQYLAKIKALNEVMTGEERDYLAKDPDKDSTQKEKESALNVLKNVFFSPYLKDKNGANTLFLSPSRLIKTCNLMSDAIAAASTYHMDESDGNIDEVKFNPKGEWGFSGIIKAIQSLLFKLGMIICVVVVMAEYTITILEFYLVRAIATLLIPMLFVDAVKSYAQNILKIFIQYFFKVMIIVMGCFFAMGLFLDVSVVIYQEFDLSSSVTLVLYISTLVTGLLFALNAAKITNTVLSGQPSLGVGEIAHGMRATLNGAHQVGVAAHNTKSALSSGAHALQGGVRAGASAASTLNSAFGAGKSAAQARAAEMRGQRSDSIMKGVEGDMSGKFDNQVARSSAFAGLKAFGASLASAGGQKLKQGAYKAATGMDYQGLNEKGEVDESKKALTMGQKFIDSGGRERRATLSDVKRNNDKRMDDVADNVVKKKSVPVNTSTETNLHKKKADGE